MKIGGIDPKTLPNEEFLVLPKGGTNVVFRARGLDSMDEFNARCPEPVMPGRMTPNGYEPMDKDPTYLEVMAEHNTRRLAYLVVKSLEPSAIEWDTVNMDSPGTWKNWEADMKKNNFFQSECNLVLTLVMQANQLDESKLKKAREVFLLGLKQASAT